MRVLIVMPGVTREGGAEQSLLAVAPSLMASGLQLHLALLTDRHALVPELERAGVVIHDLSSATSIVARARAIRQVIKAIEPGVVHATLFEASVPSELATIGTGVPALVTWAATTYTPDWFSAVSANSEWKLRLVQFADMMAGKLSAARYHAVTSGVARVNAKNLRVDRSRVLVGERGRDEALFSPDAAHVAATKAALGLPEGARVVLAVGRQDRQKAYGSLLDAFETLAGDNPDAWLLVAGREGTDTAVLQARVAAMGHADRVRFLGQRDDVAELLSLADVVVCSSWGEGAVGALIEAMACRASIVSVPLDGLEDVLVHDVNSFIAPRERLAAGLAEVLSNPELARRIAEGGRSTFEERFTIQRSADRMREIYEAVGSGSV